MVIQNILNLRVEKRKVLEPWNMSRAVIASCVAIPRTRYCKDLAEEQAKNHSYLVQLIDTVHG